MKTGGEFRTRYIEGGCEEKVARALVEGGDKGLNQALRALLANKNQR